MSIPSGSNLEEPTATDSSSAPPAPEVPLADLPLVADHQQTVVSSRSDNSNSGPKSTPDTSVEHPNPSEVLFSSDSSDSIPAAVRLEHFEVRRKIGAGGMGRVFLAEDLDLRRPVALKVLNPSSAGDPALLARFRNEARAAALLRHDNIAQVYFTGTSHGVHFIACEYIAGKTIRELIDEYETLPADLVLNYAIQTTLALNHMSAAGVIHRDIKPSNIIVSNDGRVKIVDMGLARRDSPDSVCDITVAGSTLGTFDYLAPEQARDPRVADARSDIYSLGCTLYHMLTGQPPYPEGTALQKLLDHQGKQAPDPAQINSRVPGELAEIVLTMMSTDPSDRYQTPGELLADLIEVASEMGLQGVPADGVVWQPVDEPAVRRLSGAVVLLAAVLIFCLTAVALHLMPGESAPTGFAALPGPGDAGATAGGSTVPDAGDVRPTGDSGADETADGSAGDGSDAQGNVPLPDQQKPFIVHTSDGRRLPYDTLNEALSLDRQAVRIELTFSDTLPVRQLHRLEHQNVRMYASEGAHPVLEFRGTRDDADATNMFTLVNSHLSLHEVHLKLIADESTTNSPWTVFDCAGSTSVTLTECTVDISASPETPVEVCRLEESTADSRPQHNATIRLRDTVVRGSADMFHVAACTNTQIELENCGLGLDGHLLHNTGSETMDPPGVISLQMTHVTCVTAASLIRIYESDFSAAPHSISRISMTSLAGVFCTTAEGVPLIEAEGTGPLDDLRSLLNWNGETNLYSGFDVFWTLLIPTSDPVEREDYSLEEWEDYWTRRGASARETDPVVFQWPDATWLTIEPQPGEPSVLSRLEPDWLTISPGRFYETQELPLFREHEEPGVSERQLPRFPLPDER